MSRRPAIGSTYLLNRDLVEWHRQNLNSYYPDGRFHRRLPRYLKDKLFDDGMKIEIREKLNQLHSNETPLGIQALQLGYSNISDFIESRNLRFQRKFEKTMSKNRKDI